LDLSSCSNAIDCYKAAVGIGSTCRYGAIAELPQLFDGDDDLLIGLEPAFWGASEADTFGSAGADDVSGLERGDAGEVSDQRGDFEDEIAGAGVLQGFAIDGELDVEGVGIGDFVGGSDGGTDGGEGGEGFSKSPLRGRELDVAGADVVDDGVAEDIVHGGGFRNLIARFADDEGELGLVVWLGAEFGKNDWCVGADDGAG
jgi:hypothetical protein